MVNFFGSVDLECIAKFCINNLEKKTLYIKIIDGNN